MSITAYNEIAIDFAIACMLGFSMLLAMKDSIAIVPPSEIPFKEGQKVRVNDGDEAGVVSDIEASGRIWVFFEAEAAHDWFTAAELTPYLSPASARNTREAIADQTERVATPLDFPAAA